MAFDLSELLKDVSEPDAGREQIVYIPLELLEEDPNNFYELRDLPALADNISLCGLQQPIRVRKKENGLYQIVSGHRRRAALELLVQDGYEKFKEAACIVETDAVSPTLQQLRLIYANASTRKLTSAEIAKQAEEVTALLYKLKEEGYDFPGRMRDHVSEAVGVSKSKLARLKVIRENLAPVWVDMFEKNMLVESTAYELAQLPEKWQDIIHGQWGVHPGSLYADDVKTFKKRFENVVSIRCEHGLNFCEHSVIMMEQNAKERYMAKCDKCCFDCGNLQTCGKCCPEAKNRKAELKANAKQAQLEADARNEERSRPYVDMAKLVYARVGAARTTNRVSMETLCKAQKKLYGISDDKRQRELEHGLGKFSENTNLPFGYSFYPGDAIALRNVADALGCSVDYLLGRTERMEMVSESGTEKAEATFPAAAWYPVSVEPPVGVKLVLMDSMGYVDTGKYKGCGEFDMDYGDPVVLWSPMPDEKNACTAPPVPSGWKSGSPEAYGTYAAYVCIDGVSTPRLRELLWTGDEWLLHGEQLGAGVQVRCWTEPPED